MDFSIYRWYIYGQVRRCHGCHVALTFLVFLTCPVISGATYADESHCFKHNAQAYFYAIRKGLVYSVLLAFMHEFLCGWNCHCTVFINHVSLAAYGRHAFTLVYSCLVMILLKTIRYLWRSPWIPAPTELKFSLISLPLWTMVNKYVLLAIIIEEYR